MTKRLTRQPRSPPKGTGDERQDTSRNVLKNQRAEFATNKHRLTKCYSHWRERQNYFTTWVGNHPQQLDINMKKTFFQSLLEAALWYASRGWRVFPLVPRSKRPAIRNYHAAATTDENQIRRWWKTNPQFNIGIATGGGIVVIDIDGRQGRQSLRVLEEQLGALPQTMQQRTPGQGRHLFFCSGGLDWQTRIGIDAGIDFLADRWHICAAPSVHPNGGIYVFEDGELAELPETWATWISEQEPSENCYGYGYGRYRHGGEMNPIVEERKKLTDGWKELAGEQMRLAECWKEGAMWWKAQVIGK
jgi:hypothetical protein